MRRCCLLPSSALNVGTPYSRPWSSLLPVPRATTVTTDCGVALWSGRPRGSTSPHALWGCSLHLWAAVAPAAVIWRPWGHPACARLSSSLARTLSCRRPPLGPGALSTTSDYVCGVRSSGVEAATVESPLAVALRARLHRCRVDPRQWPFVSGGGARSGSRGTLFGHGRLVGPRGG